MLRDLGFVHVALETLPFSGNLEKLVDYESVEDAQRNYWAHAQNNFTYDEINLEHYVFRNIKVFLRLPGAELCSVCRANVV